MPSINVPKWQLKNPFAFSFLTPVAGVFGGGAAKSAGFWGYQAVKKIPTIPTTQILKVATTGTILYGGYKVSEGIGRWTDTGSFTKKEIKIAAADGTLPPGTPPAITGENPLIYNIYPEETYPGTGSFFGDVGAGLGRGAGETGKGIGGGLEMAIPVLAVGGLAYLLLKGSGKGKKK